MKSILVFCVTATVILFEISSAAQIGDPLQGKSAISTEYKARFHKIHRNGLNTSEGYIAGVHNMEKQTDEESWPSFATKCAEVIKGIVNALTGAVTSEPGDRTDLHLDFRNRIYHHDNRNSNSTDVICFAGPEDYGEPEDDHDQHELPPQYAEESYPTIPDDDHHPENHAEDSDGGPEDPQFHDKVQQPVYYYESKQPGQHPEDPDHQVQFEHPEVTEASAEPTWNTPVTQEMIYTPTEQGIPQYVDFHPAMTDSNHQQGEIVGSPTPNPFPTHQATPDDLETVQKQYFDEAAATEGPYSSPALPLDHWKPIREDQQDFLQETPASFGERPVSSGHPFSVTQETYTTPSPVPTTVWPDISDFGLQHPLEAANQVYQSPPEHSSDPYEVREHPEEEDGHEYSKDEDDDHEDESPHEDHEDEPDDEEEQTHQETATTPCDELLPDATQTVPEQVDFQGKPMDYSPVGKPVPVTSNSLPQYGVPETIFRILASTTQAPPPAIYIPISSSQTESIPEGPTDLDEDCCCDEDTYDDESPRHKTICKNACRDLEQARKELKKIFDRIKKKLKCTRRLNY